MPKHIFFDLDKTLTASRSPMALPHQELFDALCRTKDVVVASGGNREQIREQTTSRFDGMYYTMAQSGNHVVEKDGTELWNEMLTPQQVEATNAFIEHLKQHFAVDVRDPNDLVENRGAQISYSVIGFHEDIQKKYSFDPDDSRRAGALRALDKELVLLNAAGVEVVPAGTTTFNFFAYGKHKGYNIRRFIDYKGWSAADCIYVGDALFPGGNDESVIGVIPTKPVTGPDDTFIFIKQMVS
jgi:HAD superfamily hydrolase (TIGR01484 family)